MHIIAARRWRLARHETLVRPLRRQILLNCQALGEELVRQGLRLVSGGTDTHLVLVDLTALDVTGKAAQEGLEAAGITVNKNAIPFDPRPPMVTSGIRIGTPALRRAA
jgi:glycine hydroxymethyltransferase